MALHCIAGKIQAGGPMLGRSITPFRGEWRPQRHPYFCVAANGPCKEFRRLLRRGSCKFAVPAGRARVPLTPTEGALCSSVVPAPFQRRQSRENRHLELSQPSAGIQAFRRLSLPICFLLKNNPRRLMRVRRQHILSVSMPVSMSILGLCMSAMDTLRGSDGRAHRY